MRKLILTLVLISCVVFLCNLRSGDGAEFGTLEERMNYIETRVSELSATTNDFKGTIKEHGSILDAIKGMQDRVSLGFGLRTSYSMTEDEAGTSTDGVSGGRDYDKDFDVDNMRLYFSAKPTDKTYVEFNTEIFNGDVDDEIRLLDAFVNYNFWNEFQLRFGRHLPASDRFNLDGPFYQNSFDFPLTAQRHPNKAIGRVEGGTFWGQFRGGKFKYYLTAAEGTEAGTANEDPDHLQWSGRFVYNFWEPEAGFYNSSAYYGKKDVLALGLVMFHQSDAVGTAAESKDFTSWNFDFLFEKNYGWGVINAEAAYFDYNLHGAGTTEGTLTDGSSWLGVLSYMYPQKIGWGYPQLVTRYQNFDNSATDKDTGNEERLDLSLHYIIKDHNGKIALTWSNFNPGRGGNDDFNQVKLGMQWQH